MNQAAQNYRHTFQDHLTLKRYAPKTKESYRRSVTDLSAFYKQPADQLTNHQIQAYLKYLIQDKQLAWSSCNVSFCGLLSFYRDYLGRSEAEFTIPPRTRSQKVALLLSREEVTLILNAKKNIKHRALLYTIYGSGLRVSEAVRLKPEHIESQPDRMMIRVEQGKGRKDRYTVLSEQCLHLLREYWREAQPGEWLFYGNDKKKPMSVGTAQAIYYQAKKKAGVTRACGIHTLRHSFATHLMEDGTDMFIIKRYLGHRSIVTTCKYLHLSPAHLRKTISPLDLLYADEAGES